MNNDLISVIIPVYNIEKYLGKCIKSVMEQTYKNIEIILVNDGSTDSCGKICDYYKKIDNRIVVIHKTNGGLSSARNEGLNVVKGSFVCFVDGDDYIENNMLEELKKNMDKYDSDISVSNFYLINNTKKISIDESISKNFCIQDKDKYIHIYNKYSSLTVPAWNKLYKKNIFDNVRYPDGKIFEDASVLCDILNNAKKVSYTLKPLYNYVYRKESITHNSKIEHSDRFSYYDSRINFFIEKGYYDLIEKEKNRKMNALISYLYRMKMNKIYNDKIKKDYYSELHILNKDVKWKNATKYNKFYKVFRKPSISILAFMLKVRDKVKR